ncbi:hypothetical protein ASO15_06250 [Escherichia coli O157:H7]|nr:hypothetical protein ASO15_06250 [Escherichia coli O157:H7]
MLPSETMIWQPEFTDKTLSRKTGAVHFRIVVHHIQVFCICLDVERCQQVIPPVSGQGNALWQ